MSALWREKVNQQIYSVSQGIRGLEKKRKVGEKERKGDKERETQRETEKEGGRQRGGMGAGGEHE